MTVTTVRSHVQQAEDRLLAILGAERCTNVSRQDANRFQIQIRYINQDVVEEANKLIENWEGSNEQIRQVRELYDHFRRRMLKHGFTVND